VNKDKTSPGTVFAAITPNKFATKLLFLWRLAASPFIGWYGYIRGELLYRRNRESATGVDLTVDPSAGTNPLTAYFDANTEGPGLWKWRHYFDVYHRHFQKYIGKEVHIVEIGVFSGGSLNMWREYFGPDCHVHGVDLEESCLTYEREGVTIHVGDQADRSFWKRFRSQVPRVDIVVDDGGHTVRQQRTTLEELLPHISPGGIYVCEDIQGSYNRFNSYVNGLSHLLNAHNPDSTVVGAATESDVKSQLQGAISSISHYPYMVVIEKLVAPVQVLKTERRGTEWQPFIPLPDQD
jgi:hypothetical protein